MSPMFYESEQASGSGSPVNIDSAFQTPDGLSDGPFENEPIAIIGIGCRLPGGVKSPQDLWEFLNAGGSGQGDVPSSRFNIDGFYHPNGSERPGSLDMRGGYFLKENIRSFENSFFGINNLEATYMDPQQRKLLEVVYEALESAGVTLEQISGANIGTYVGSFAMDFWTMQARDSEYFQRLSATGMGTTILANRISHTLNLRGPSFVLDTACSSSLYGLHLACAALDAGECDAAVVAAANLIQSPEQHLGTMKAGVLSPTSTCHTFDSSADGYGRGEGVGALYIKKLSKAIADGDPVRAVIRGTAINSNGKTQGITLPSAIGQEAVIRKAYEKAGLHDFQNTGYVECHGTGTPVGDPIEVEAVSRVFGKGRTESTPLYIGSIKPNLGHSEAASGISSIIKACLALETGHIPPTIGVKKLNPKIKDKEWGVHIVTTHDQKFPIRNSAGKSIRRAGINSFGYGGANSHAILESAAMYLQRPDDELAHALSLARSKFLIPLSASNPTAIEAQAEALVNSGASYNLVDLAHTLGTRRSRLSHRGFALVNQTTQKEDLRSERFQTTAMGTFSKLPIGFVFTGQGAQWPQMGKELLEEMPSFRRTIQELDAVLQTLPEAPSWTLEGVIANAEDSTKINHVTRSQPICTAIQIAYVNLLASWGIEPEGVIGHSSGEIGAAYAAGKLSAAQAIVVAYYRGYVIGKSASPTPGGMMAAGMGREAADAEIDALGLRGVIKVACVNSPESVTISGDAIGIDKLLSEIQTRGVFARRLKTDGRAYHSHHMTLYGPEYQELLEKRLPTLPPASTAHKARWVSSVFNEEVIGDVSAAYWRKNLEQPVLFSDAFEGLMQDSKFHLVELGPHSALELPIKQTKAVIGFSDSDIHYSNALSRGKNAVDCVLNLMGRLYLHGHNIDFTRVNYVESSLSGDFNFLKKQGRVIPDLPTYPWTYDGAELWYEGRQSREFRDRKHPHHDLIGTIVLGGNGVTTQWRNKLRVKDIPWVEGHKLGQDVVLPGAAYVAMAIEAVGQVSSVTRADKPTVILRNFHILKALPLSMETNDAGVETFTSIRRAPISGTINSEKWYQFEVSTHNGVSATSHATGMISIEKNGGLLRKDLVQEQIELEELAIRNWYDRFVKIGLNFGETFRTIKSVATHRKKQHMYARSKVPYQTGGGSGLEIESEYIMHPTTIDAMLQSGLIASSAGVLKDLPCKVPTVIGEARFKASSSIETPSTWLIDALSKPMGLGAIQIAAELHDGQGQVCAQLKDVSLVAFQGASASQDEDERHPMLRVVWKPDVAKIRQASGLSKYLSSYAGDMVKELPESTKKLARLVDLVAHRNPTLNILELGSNRDVSTYLLDTLRVETAFTKCTSYTRGYISEGGDLIAEEILNAQSLDDSFEKATAQNGKKYDVILLPSSQDSERYSVSCSATIQSLLDSDSIIISVLPSTATLSAPVAETFDLEVPVQASNEKVMLRRANTQEKKIKKLSSILIVERDGDQAFVDLMVPILATHFQKEVRRVSLDKLSVSDLADKPTIVSTVELNKPILSSLSATEMLRVKLMTDNASNLIWLTGGANMSGTKPETALVSGLSRALMLEQPSLRFFVFDVEDPRLCGENTVHNIAATIEDAHSIENPDFEFVERNGMLHVSRFVPDEDMNATFRMKQDEISTLKALREVESAKLTIKELGNFETLAFKQEPVPEAQLASGYVEVQVKTIGLNVRDIQTYSGKAETKNASTSSECAGVVTRVGSEVSNLKPGDRVVVMAPGHFATIEAFPEWACAKLEASETFSEVSALPTAFATALYALRTRAQLREKETVLVHNGASSVGIAAIQIAQLFGARVLTTASNNDERHFLIVNLGIRPQDIFSSVDSSFLADVLSATSGRGANVVLNSLTGDLLHDSWRACAKFGRFVELGSRDISDAGRLDMEMFRKNVTFTAFNISDLCDAESSDEWQRLLHEVMTLYREEKIRAFAPLKTYNAGQVEQAFKHGLSKKFMGKVVVSFEDKNCMVKVLPLRYDTNLSADKTYLMIGCLGGLGRSMSKWMIKQGARKFVFLGRSGTDKKAAHDLVEDLRDSGAHVTVVRGDVSNYNDVKKCVEVIDGDIGGVVQAAMGLSEALWTTMSSDFWHNGIDPKLIGTFNLHNAIKGKDSKLDFFLMTSSVSGSVGTATESNYCSANYFLDVFARYRQAQGLPAMSLGLGMISEVGYLHENPEIEALLLRKGIQAINEKELLQIVDISLSSQPDRKAIAADPLAASHILTGLEPLGLKELRKKGFEGTNITLNDARASVLSSALDRQSSSGGSTNNSGLPEEVAAAMSSGGDVSSAIIVVIAKRFSSLILVPVEKIDAALPITKFGMDSMLAAEFRTWFYQTFKTDIPFLSLLSETMTIKELAELVKKDLEENA